VTTAIVTREFAAPPQRVYAALTDASALASWFWPSTWDTRVSSQPTVGGSYRIESAANDIAVSGQYVAVAPFDSISFTWQWDGESESSLVTVTIVAVGDASDVTLVHEGLASETERQNHLDGWESCFDRLPEYLNPATN
jgi:uncharacterized protein YndB with AHSA1/START domain